MALSDNLESYWPLDEASGTRADAHGSNDLTDNNTVGSATGKQSNGADFETTSSEYLSLASNSSIQAGDIDFTFAFWVKFESRVEDAVLISKDVDSPANSRDYTIDYRQVEDDIRFYVNGGAGGLVVASNVSFSDATWYFVVAWHNASANTLNLKIDNGSTQSTGTSGTAPEVSGAPFRIGARAFASFEGFFDGIIDEVGYWKRVLTADEITDLYNSGNGRDYAYIVGGGGATVPTNLSMVAGMHVLGGGIA